MEDLIIIAIIFAVIFIASLVFVIKSQFKANNKVKNSPKFKAIAEHIFTNGQRPSRIAITFGSEIFYGPINGQFYQVPADLVPSMNQEERRALGSAFESEYKYKYHMCNSGIKSGFGAAPADTGNQYIDTHAEVLLISKVSVGSEW